MHYVHVSGIPRTQGVNRKQFFQTHSSQHYRVQYVDADTAQITVTVARGILSLEYVDLFVMFIIIDGFSMRVENSKKTNNLKCNEASFNLSAAV